MISPIRVLTLTRYGAKGASSRLRMLQYLPFLRSQNIQVEVQALFDDAALESRYLHGKYGLSLIIRSFFKRICALRQRHRFDLLWIEKEALPWWPFLLEQTLLRGVPYVLDYDDAVFHQYDQHRLSLVRKAFGQRLDRLMAQSALVVSGNEYLAARARASRAQHVVVLPTVIDLQRYPTPTWRNPISETPRIVWIGSPSTATYLQILLTPLQQLAKEFKFVLKVIGAKVNLPGVPTESIEWSEKAEVAELSMSNIGVMPLPDTPWEQGKCGYKLIQYMACGLPVVASPVGANLQIVQNSVNGFLADTTESWLTSLKTLLTDAALRTQMGKAGRLQVETSYCLQVTAPKLAGLLRGSVEH